MNYGTVRMNEYQRVYDENETLKRKLEVAITRLDYILLKDMITRPMFGTNIEGYIEHLEHKIKECGQEIEQTLTLISLDKE